MTPPPSSGTALPAWATDLVALYESNAVNQFILPGNVNDRILLPAPDNKAALGNLQHARHLGTRRRRRTEPLPHRAARQHG